MDSTTPYLRTQTELLADIEALIRDSSNVRWTEAEIYRAINLALLTWHDKVKFERTYTITDGWVAGTYAYTLPAYVRPPIFPELLRQLPNNEWGAVTGTSRWQDVVGWELVGNSLRLYAAPRTGQGQVVFYAPNSRVPLPTLPTTNAQIVAADTSVTMGSAVDIDDVGYVKINAEYISYTGVTRASATTTLLNLTRALNGSTAATHNSGSTVTWCVAADSMSLYSFLYDQVRSILSGLPLSDGSTHERLNYEKMMGYFENRAAIFWQQYHPIRRTSPLTLNRRALSLR